MNGTTWLSRERPENTRLAWWGIAVLALLQVLACAPAKAVDYVYFLDADQDGYGSPTERLSTQIPYPPNRLYVPWGNDPDDNDKYAFPLAAPKGDRQMELDFSGTSGGNWRPDLARELGVELAPVDLSWRTLEPDANGFAEPDLDSLNTAANGYQSGGFRMELALNPIEGSTLVLPADLTSRVVAGTLKFDAPEMAWRYAQLIDALRVRIQPAQMAGLQVGKDIDGMLMYRKDPAFWEEYGRFLAQVRSHAHLAWGNSLPVGVSVRAEALFDESTRALLAPVLANVDFVSVTYMPMGSATTAREPWDLGGDVERILYALQGVPLHLKLSGLSSSEASNGSELKQTQYLHALFDVWDRYAAAIPVVDFGKLYDPVAAGSSVDALLIASSGLRHDDASGTAKAAYATLRNLAFERGWWRIPDATTRSFHMGFVPTAYDNPPDPYQQLDVMAWVDDKITREGDLVTLHMDGGVPWVEAYADDFSSDTPPYSPSVMGNWQLARSRVPAGHKLMVSINPLGIPRDVLAPYWGVGEGFTYTQDFGRVGNGIIADGERRMLPPPWGTYEFDSPQVEQAYVNYARRVLRYFKPDYLCFAIEITATAEADPVKFEHAKNLIRHVYTTLKSLPETGSTKLFVSFSATSLMADEYAHLLPDPDYSNGVAWKYEDMEPHVLARVRQGFKDLMPYNDMIALSLYPHYGKYGAYQLPASMFDSLWQLIKDDGLTHKPVLIAESGYAAVPYTLFDDLFTGSPDRQNRFYKLLFYELEKIPNPVELVTAFQVRDSDLLIQRLAATEPDPRFLEFYKYFRSIGLYGPYGGERPATTTWRKEFALPLAPKN